MLQTTYSNRLRTLDFNRFININISDIVTIYIFFLDDCDSNNDSFTVIYRVQLS